MHSQVLSDTQHQLNCLHSENQKLKGDIATVKADNRLLHSKLKAAGVRYAPQESADSAKALALKTGVIYIASCNLCWGRNILFGPEHPSHFEPDPLTCPTFGDDNYTNFCRYWLYTLAREDGRSSLADKTSEFVKQVCKYAVSYHLS